ncbi:ricin-type beta-trefoil lectin domain protein [Streptomyces canus]|uniref:RICIN domain-containing protein n=1 Tax=Streptomyces canus TaxID=58343 RepID=UPI0003657A27|nr:ricin-type beta-trefoil lectin domain protein [Streptomyces canus]
MRRPTRKAFAALIAAAGLAFPLLTPTPASAATTTSRFANYRYGDCLRESDETELKGDRCNSGRGSILWHWNGRLNTSTTLKNYTWGRCLDSNDRGDVYPLPCNGGSYQKWRTVQPAARSAIMLQSVGTGRCLYQQDNGYYRTARCDRGAQNQRFTIG